MAKAYLVVRIKGQADVPYWANTTLNLLNLEKKLKAFNCKLQTKDVIKILVEKNLIVFENELLVIK